MTNLNKKIIWIAILCGGMFFVYSGGVLAVEPSNTGEIIFIAARATYASEKATLNTSSFEAKKKKKVAKEDTSSDGKEYGILNFGKRSQVKVIQGKADGTSQRGGSGGYGDGVPGGPAYPGGGKDPDGLGGMPIRRSDKGFADLHDLDIDDDLFVEDGGVGDSEGDENNPISPGGNDPPPPSPQSP